MAKWTDLAPWIGPSPNITPGGMKRQDVRGVVLHIASGFYLGTIAWQKNPKADVSSTWIVGRDGQIGQMVDTNDMPWAQRDGNPYWLSIEAEGFAPDDDLHATHPGWEKLTAAQIERCAQILARVHREYGDAQVPLQLATSPSGRGLGHHSMGAESGANWGHSQCPGTAMKNQKQAILTRAIAIVRGPIAPPPEVTVMGRKMLVRGFAPNPSDVWLVDGMTRRNVTAFYGGGTGPVSNAQIFKESFLGNLWVGTDGTWEGQVFVSGGDPNVWGVDITPENEFEPNG